jgi:hypothetical protein
VEIVETVTVVATNTLKGVRVALSLGVEGHLADDDTLLLVQLVTHFPVGVADGGLANEVEPKSYQRHAGYRRPTEPGSIVIVADANPDAANVRRPSRAINQENTSYQSKAKVYNPGTESATRTHIPNQSGHQPWKAHQRLGDSLPTTMVPRSKKLTMGKPMENIDQSKRGPGLLGFANAFMGANAQPAMPKTNMEMAPALHRVSDDQVHSFVQAIIEGADSVDVPGERSDQTISITDDDIDRARRINSCALRGACQMGAT